MEEYVLPFFSISGPAVFVISILVCQFVTIKRKISIYFASAIFVAISGIITIGLLSLYGYTFLFFFGDPPSFGEVIMPTFVLLFISFLFFIGSLLLFKFWRHYFNLLEKNNNL